jgi:hypothetical protein
MTDYDREYFFLRKPDAARFPFLFPDENTQDRDYQYARQAPDSPPLIFTNAWADENKRRRISTVTPKVLFDGTDIAVHTSIYEQLIALDLPGVYMHPSVYIDDDGIRHHDYWYLTFPVRFNCWDRQTSRVDDTPIDLGDEMLYQVFAYRLDKKRLDQTPLRHRLLFKMGGTIDPFLVCHESIRSLFSADDAGVRLQAVGDS